jgi:hypothetical protein
LPRQLPELTEMQVRYNPANPDQALALPNDNQIFFISIWPL